MISQSPRGLAAILCAILCLADPVRAEGSSWSTPFIAGIACAGAAVLIAIILLLFEQKRKSTRVEVLGANAGVGAERRARGRQDDLELVVEVVQETHAGAQSSGAARSAWTHTFQK